MGLALWRWVVVVEGMRRKGNEDSEVKVEVKMFQKRPRQCILYCHTWRNIIPVCRSSSGQTGLYQYVDTIT